MCMRNINSSQVIPCSIKWIAEVLIMVEEPLEDSKILQIIDAREQYDHYMPCFSLKQAARLLEQKCWDNQIPLWDLKARIPKAGICKTHWEKDIAHQKFSQENISTGKFRYSRPFTTTSIQLVRKKDWSHRRYIDYRALSCLPLRNKYPLPLISELLNKTRLGKWFTRLDLKNGYNLIKIAVGDGWKTACHSKERLFG